MPDAVCLGELLIDFVPTVTGVTLIEAPAFRKAPGGAPANVAVGLSRLGVSSGFMGKVGDDPFGHFLARTLAEAGVDVSALRYATEARTALAFVSLRADGEREFAFYRHPSADMLYTPAEVAREAGLLVSYDPNLRPALWADAEAARAGIRLGWREADVIKVSEEELEFLTGDPDPADAARKLWHDRLRLLAVTRGHLGCRYFTATSSGEVASFAVAAVDTTGAGDGFMAGLLRGLLLDGPEAAVRDEMRLRAICRLANAVGALTTTERGAIPALPTLDRVKAFLAPQGPT